MTYAKRIYGRFDTRPRTPEYVEDEDEDEDEDDDAVENIRTLYSSFETHLVHHHASRNDRWVADVVDVVSREPSSFFHFIFIFFQQRQ